jgi:LmbE family N-acetylglucosaminyl deacetylase
MRHSETHYLPFHASELPGGPWLILAPHPDDEVFGLGGSIALAKKQGIPVDVLFMTDGALGCDGLSREETVAVREKEARQAAATLGIRNVTFWHQPDRGLEPGDSLVSDLSALIEEHRINTLFLPSPVEPHPDHRAAALVGWEAARSRGTKAMSYEISVQAPVNTLIDITPVVADKKSAMNLYGSQVGNHRYIERVLALNVTRAWSLPEPATHAEGLFDWGVVSEPFADALQRHHARMLQGLEIAGPTPRR